MSTRTAHQASLFGSGKAAALGRGTAKAAGLAFALFSAGLAHAQWTVTNLHPAGATRSRAMGIEGAVVGGDATFSGVRRAGIWVGGEWVDFWFSNVTDSGIYDVTGGKQVGWYTLNGTTTHASLWSGTTGSRVNLQPTDCQVSAASGTDGVQQAGWGYFSNVRQAGWWNGSSGTWVNLAPAGATDSYAIECDGAQQSGAVVIAGVRRATLWTGTQASRIDLHPSGAAHSDARCVRDGVQGGWAEFDGVSRACLWSGSAASWIDLHPSQASASFVSGVHQAWQVGGVTIDGVARTAVWRGSAETFEDLSAALIGSWSSSTAGDIWSDGTTLFVAGSGFNTATNREEALLWSRPILTGCPSDTDADGDVDFADLNALLAAWGAAVPPGSAGDSDADGIIDFADLNAMLVKFGSADCGAIG